MNSFDVVDRECCRRWGSMGENSFLFYFESRKLLVLRYELMVSEVTRK